MAEGFFWGNDPNVNSQLRQRIALAMLSRRSKYPRNFGEGLAAIGESLGDIGMARRLEQQDLADQAKDRALSGETAAPGATRTSEDATTPPATRTAYAPAADVAPAEPAEPAAPNLLAQLPTATETAPGDMTTAAAQPSTMLNSQPMLSTSIQTPPAGRFAPQREAIARTIAAQRTTGGPLSATTIRDQGDYNEIDASAGMKRVTPGYMQDAIARNVADPDMRAYLGGLSAGEARNAQEVSPTGAAGPFQFTRGTAKQYDLMPPGHDLRGDLDASTIAAHELTNDNAAAFRKINGREPTMADLALMHQQGGVTGAKMVAGTGNAPAANLAVNNVPPGASPADAVAKIKGYYGMPETPIGPRDAAAAALMPKPPVMAFDGRPSPANTTPPLPLQSPAAQQIQPAPPAAPPIAQAPVRVAQALPPGAQPTAIPGYVPPGGGPEPAVPAKTPYSPKEVQLMREFNDARRSGNQYTIDRTTRELAVAAEKRQYDDARNLEVYKEKLKQRDEANRASEAAKVTQTERLNADQKAQAELVEKRNEAEIIRRSNMKPEELYKRLDTDKQSVDQAIKAQSAQALARKAIKDGVITGYGANMRIAKEKFADWAFKNGLKGDLAANTEIMSAGLKAGLSEAVKTVNGEGGTGVSNTDVRIAEGISGSDPNLQMKTIQTIMDRAAEINFRKINRYEDYIDKTLGGLPVELKYRSTHGPTAPADKIDMLMKAQADPTKADAYRGYFDQIYGPGAAELELARVERLNRRRARGG